MRCVHWVNYYYFSLEGNRKSLKWQNLSKVYVPSELGAERQHQPEVDQLKSSITYLFKEP